MLLARQIGNVTLIFAGNTRLPMVAGWDRLVPAWFTRLHPRYRTPYNSILFVGALTLVLTLLGQIGVGLQEAYQLIENAAGIFYAFTYLALFAIPLFGAQRLGVTPPLWLRVMAASWLRRIAALLGAVGVSDHRRRELADLRGEDHQRAGDRQRHRGCDLSRGTSACGGTKPRVTSAANNITPASV